MIILPGLSVLDKLRFKQSYLKQTVSNFHINEWLYLALHLFNAEMSESGGTATFVRYCQHLCVCYECAGNRKAKEEEENGFLIL